MSGKFAIAEQNYHTDHSENSKSSQDSNPLTYIAKKFLVTTTNSVSWKRPQLRQEFYDMLDECSIENWDGYDSSPLNIQAAREAESFIDLMPIEWPDPDPVPEPDGDIGFQWSFGRNRILTVSFSGDNILMYVCISGSLQETISGWEYFNDTIPTAVLESIAKIRS